LIQICSTKNHVGDSDYSKCPLHSVDIVTWIWTGPLWAGFNENCGRSWIMTWFHINTTMVSPCRNFQKCWSCNRNNIKDQSMLLVYIVVKHVAYWLCILLAMQFIIQLVTRFWHIQDIPCKSVLVWEKGKVKTCLHQKNWGKINTVVFFFEDSITEGQQVLTLWRCEQKG